jgi:hypothetical protein
MLDNLAGLCIAIAVIALVLAALEDSLAKYEPKWLRRCLSNLLSRDEGTN